MSKIFWINKVVKALESILSTFLIDSWTRAPRLYSFPKGKDPRPRIRSVPTYLPSVHPFLSSATSTLVGPSPFTLKGQGKNREPLPSVIGPVGQNFPQLFLASLDLLRYKIVDLVQEDILNQSTNCYNKNVKINIP